MVAALAVLGFAAGDEVFNAERAVTFVGDAVDDQQGYLFKGFHHFCNFLSHTDRIG